MFFSRIASINFHIHKDIPASLTKYGLIQFLMSLQSHHIEGSSFETVASNLHLIFKARTCFLQVRWKVQWLNRCSPFCKTILISLHRL